MDIIVNTDHPAVNRLCKVLEQWDDCEATIIISQHQIRIIGTREEAYDLQLEWKRGYEVVDDVKDVYLCYKSDIKDIPEGITPVLHIFYFLDKRYDTSTLMKTTPVITYTGHNIHRS